jgi:hypothetical protein
MVKPSVEKATDVTPLLCALCFSALSSREAVASVWGRLVLGWVRNMVGYGVPASQTLIVLSSEPDTMLEPSGEKATEFTESLCALCFSALSSRDAVASVGALSFGLGEEYGGLRHTCIPDFDRLVGSTRDDRRAIGRELYSRD